MDNYGNNKKENFHTVYLARHTGEFVVRILSALRGFPMSNIFTVQS